MEAMDLKWLAYLLVCSLCVLKCQSSTCPSSCYCDEGGDYVSCVGDGIWKLPSDVPMTTVRLELRNYFIGTLSSQDVQELLSLQELKVQQSRIENIENATFAALQKLQRLDLSQNLISSLSSAVFEGLDKLRFLDLSSNTISSLDEAFVTLSSLEQFNLRDNRISQLTTHTFVGLQKVQYLNLDSNNISSIEVGTFQYLTNLAHLIISNNPLTTLSRLDFFGSRLQFIDISRVGLERVPQSLTKFVRDLRLAKNNLTRISAGDFESYPYLGLLVLDDNCVSEIENDALGRQEYLMRLWLNGNCLTKVPPNLPPSLLALYMEENKLAELGGYSFKGLVRLEQLFLQRNDIRSLSTCAFCDLISLKSLDLQANRIENLTGGIFSNLSQLETLDLSQNILKSIDSRSFDGLTLLKTLQMSRVATDVHVEDDIFDPLQSLQTLEVYDSSLLVHKIIKSTRLLHGLRKVQELNIMHNRIVHLRADFPSFLPNLKIIKMSGNLWRCDSDILWLSIWMKQSNIQFYSSYSIRCASPEILHFKPLMMLTEEDVRTTSTTHEVPVTLSAIQSVSTMRQEQITSFSSSLITPPFSLQTKQDESYKKPTHNSNDTITLSTNSTADITVPTENSTHLKFMSAHPFRYQIINDHTETSIPSSTEINPDLNSTAVSLRTSVSTPVFSSAFNVSEPKNSTGILATTISYDLVHREVSTTHPVISATVMLTTSKYVSTTDRPIENSYSPEMNQSRSVTSQKQIYPSRLRGWTTASPTGQPRWNQTTAIIASAVLGGIFLLIVFGVLTMFTMFRCRHRYQPVKHRQMRRSSSISYYPQKDEVSIVTLTEGTVGLRTNSHHGLGNKLYYIMENGGSTGDPTKEAFPDPQLQELLPQSSPDNVAVY